jgi:hypothetical protein
MDSKEEFSVAIIYDELEQEEGAKDLFGGSGKLVRKTDNLDTTKLADKLDSFCKSIGKAFEGVSTSVKDYELQSFEIAVEVTGKGEIRFIGSISSEIKGGIKLVFSRQGSKS